MIGSVTVFESPLLLCKRWQLDGNGIAVKTSAAQMTRGRFSVESFDNVEALCALLESTTTHQALCCSLPVNGSSAGAITTKALREPGALTRTKADFALKPVPGILFLDSDDGGLGRDELWGLMTAAIPALANAGVVWRPSGSSHIVNTADGSVVTGLRGQHIAVMVQDASDAVRVTRVLAARLWLMHHGRVVVSEVGALLLRCPVDIAVAEAARLLFVGGSDCNPPLEQQRGRALILADGGFLDTRIEVPDLTAEEQGRYEALIDQAKAAALPEANQRRDAHRRTTVTRRLPDIMKTGASAAEADARISAAIDAAFGGTLLSDFELTVVDESGQSRNVTVGQILADRDRYHEADCLDPLNPEHRGGAADCRLFLHGTSPAAYSFDDGGRVYRLRAAQQKITVTEGRRAELVSQLAEAISSDPRVFLSDAGPILVENGRRRTLTVERMMGLIGSVALLVRISAKGDERSIDVTREIASLVLTEVSL